MTMEPLSEAILRLQEIMRTLRSPDGCPWDARQTSQTLKPYLLEETYEVLDAIDHGAPEDLCEELGDLLLQVVFHAQIWAEQDAFDLAAVARGIGDKLVRRHPHVFGGVSESNPAALDAQWDRIKQAEKGRTPTLANSLDNLPRNLPALLRAAKILERQKRYGLPVPDLETAIGELCQGLDEFPRESACLPRDQAEELYGELLLAVATIGHNLELSGEDALRRALGRRQEWLENQERHGSMDWSTTEPSQAEGFWPGSGKGQRLKKVKF